MNVDETGMEVDNGENDEETVVITEDAVTNVNIEAPGTTSEIEIISQTNFQQDDINSTPNNNLVESNATPSDCATTRSQPYEDDEEGTLCPICLDNWTNSGEHRICSLKCGHVFCHKCVTRWLDTQQHKSCPTCKKRARKQEIRFIYAKKLIAVDNSELEALRHQLNLVIEEKHKIQLDLSKYICREGIYKQNIAHLQNKIEELTSKEANYRCSEIRLNEETSNTHSKLYMEKSLEICKQNGCRVFDSSTILDLIMVSSKSPNSLFAGFGIRKINMSQYKPLAFIPLHQQQIRDISYCAVNNRLLTVSMDKTFKVTDLSSNKVLFASSLTMPLWSCCWDKDNHNYLYVGTQAGTLVKYDVRSLGEPISTLSIPGDMSPVVSIASISGAPGTEFPLGGVISCKLNSLWVFENEGNDYTQHSISLNGPFVSMKYHNETRQMLISSRPNNLISHSRHSLCNLSKDLEGTVNCNIIHTFSGGGMQKLLSKSCFVFDKQEYVAAYEESNKCVFLWNINTGQKTCSLPAREAVLDLKGIKTCNGSFLISLTERKMEFFKFN
ncbi:unnamed protein product [Psylliodes chrysocephalus]|uniref:RING-type E3 ubiquitin transferase n=1 Tax=Psylliodes chrysocephalus TaxID=3402493 RepID=A0A9P0G4F1_9CUCU|nr:unnamed protein product [Psylliodes chrysocephala]